MEDHSITGFMDSFTSLSNFAMIFNISPCASVATSMPQQNIPSLISNMKYSISCTIYMSPSCDQEFFLQNSWNTTSMLLQSRGCRNQQKSGILQLPPYIFWCRSFQRFIWKGSFHINSPSLQWNPHILVWQEKYETSKRSYNAETRAMYTGVLDQNCIRNLFISIGYPIEPP